MKFLLIAMLCLGSVSAYSHDEEGTVEEMKTKMMSRLDEKISHINEAKACIGAATTKEALKACKQKMHDQRKAKMKEWKENKKNRKEKKEKKD